MISAKPNMIVIANVFTDFNCIFQFKNLQKKSAFSLSLPPLSLEERERSGVRGSENQLILRNDVGVLERAVSIYRWLD